MIPYGILANSLAIVLGGIFGTVVGKVLPKRVVSMLPSVLGLSAMGIGMMNVVKGANVSTIILTLLLGAVLGELLSLEQRAKQAVRSMIEKFFSRWLCYSASVEQEFSALCMLGSLMIILFCMPKQC